MVEHRQDRAVEVEGVADLVDGERGAGDRPGRGLQGERYHWTRPFCQERTRSRRRNSKVIEPEQSRASTTSAA